MRSCHNRSDDGKRRLSKPVCHWTLKHNTVFCFVSFILFSLFCILFSVFVIFLRFRVLYFCHSVKNLELSYNTGMEDITDEFGALLLQVRGHT